MKLVNESIEDVLKPKDLSGDAKIIYDIQSKAHVNSPIGIDFKDLKNIDDYWLHEASYWAAKVGNLEYTKFILDKQIQQNKSPKAKKEDDWYRIYAFRDACIYEHPEIVKFFIDHGVISTFKKKFPQHKDLLESILKLSIIKGNVKIIKMLLDENMPISEEAKNAAFYKSDPEILSLLKIKKTPDKFKKWLNSSKQLMSDFYISFPDINLGRIEMHYKLGGKFTFNGKITSAEEKQIRNWLKNSSHYEFTKDAFNYEWWGRYGYTFARFWKKDLKTNA